VCAEPGRPQVEIGAALTQAAGTSSGLPSAERVVDVLDRSPPARAADASGPARPTSIAAGRGLRARKTGAATPAADGLDLELTPGRRNRWDARPDDDKPADRARSYRR
jgi:hypothetical protein